MDNPTEFRRNLRGISDGIPPYQPTVPTNQRGTTPTPLPRGRSFRGLSPEARALASEAYALWGQLARERSNPYGDHTGCLLAGRMAVDATRWEDGLVILAAIRERMDEKSSPRWIPEWARIAGAGKREEDHHTRLRAAREAEADLDPEVARVIAGISRAKARGQAVALEDFYCAVCRQFAETKCPRCARALHARSCPARHACEAVA